MKILHSILVLLVLLHVSSATNAGIQEIVDENSQASVRFDGLYEAKRSLVNYYIRFFEDGKMSKLSHESVEKAAPHLTRVSFYKYTTRGNRIDVIFSPKGTIELSGTIRNNLITLRSNFGEECTYEFVEFDFSSLKKDTGKRASTSPAPPSKAAGKTFIITGRVTYDNKPMSGKTLVVSPIDPKTGRAFTKFTPTGEGILVSINPLTKTDSDGRFTIEVPFSLFSESSGKCSLGVYDDLGGGRLQSSFESVTIEYSAATPRIDMGEIAVKPLK